jgi:hypothetical protein
VIEPKNSHFSKSENKLITLNITEFNIEGKDLLCLAAFDNAAVDYNMLYPKQTSKTEKEGKKR